MYELLAGERQAGVSRAFTEEWDDPVAVKSFDWPKGEKSL